MLKNFEIIKSRFPQIYNKLQSAKDELNVKIEFKNNTLKINNLSCYSKYDPVREARNFLKDKELKKDVIVFGISNPFILKQLLKDHSVSLFIPDIGYFKKLLNLIDYSEILSSVKNIFLSKNEINIEDYSFIELRIEKRIFSHKLKALQRFQNEYLKVLLVNPIYGGSLPIAQYISKNLSKFNIKLKVINSEILHEAYRFINKSFINKRNISAGINKLLDLISEIILITLEEFHPDVIFGVAQSPISIKVLKYCEDKEILKLFWFMEDYKLFTYWKDFAPFYDYYFTIQKDEFFDKLKNIGVKNYHYLPLAAEPSVHKPLELSEKEKKYYGSTLSFVGAGYYNRRIFFRNLIDYDFKIWGSDWEGETVLSKIIQENGKRIPPEEYVKIFNASLININLHSSTYLPGVDPEGDFVNPRTFEICATDSIQVVDRRKYLPELYLEGKEILVYSNIQELKSLIENILRNPKKYKEIAYKGYLRTLKEHTYEHRLKEIFRLIGFELKKIEFHEGTEEFYFFKFDSIDDIANYIKKKDKINETEIIFLIMKALKDTYLK